jgi:alkylated DNA repair dioxygenase AlkB
MSSSRRLRADQPGLFDSHAPPPGFVYRENVLSEFEERALVERIAGLPFAPFEFQGHLGNRRVVSFGWRYDYGGRALRSTTPFPDFLMALRKEAAVFAGLGAERFEQALVTEYGPGAGIGWHRDKAVFQDVVAFSFLAPCVLRFRRRQGLGWERRKLTVAPRSAYLLRGPARQEWEHSIPAQEILRYSVTFRTLALAPFA